MVAKVYRKDRHTTKTMQCQNDMHGHFSDPECALFDGSATMYAKNSFWRTINVTNNQDKCADYLAKHFVFFYDESC